MSKKKKRKGGGGLPRTIMRPVPVAAPVPKVLGWRDDQTATPVMLPEDSDPPTLVLPTIALRSIANVAATEEMEMGMSLDVERRLSPTGKHMLTGMQRIKNPDGSDFIRAKTMLQMRDVPVGRATEMILDFPTRYIGMLLDAAERKPDRDAAEPATMVYQWKPEKPVWAGSYSFAPVWNRAVAIAEEAYGQRAVDGFLDPRGLMAMSALSLMKDAHLVRVEPEQVQVLPEWEDAQNLWDYAQDVVLPFERLYLDFEGPGGFAPTHSIAIGDGDESLDIELRGALVWRDTDGKLVVTAIGWPTTWTDHRNPRSAFGFTRHEVVGSVIFGNGSVYEHVLQEVGQMTMRLGESNVKAQPLGISTAAITPGNLPGYVQIPIDMNRVEQVRGMEGLRDETRETIATPEGLRDMVAGWAQVALSAAGRTLAALSILEADEVELVDHPMEERKRAKAEKLGWHISQVVFIRPGKRYLNPNPASGELMEYSHRFWVRAHVKHFPVGTRVADSRPDLVKACHRCGSCRRVPTKAFIKGPPDRPLVPKSLAVRRDRPRVTQLPKRDSEPDYYVAPGV